MRGDGAKVKASPAVPVVVEGAARNMKLMQLLVVITFMIMYLFALSRKLVILFQYKLFYCSDEG